MESSDSALDAFDLRDDFDTQAMWANVESLPSVVTQGLGLDNLWSYVEQCKIKPDKEIYTNCRQRYSINKKQASISPVAKLGNTLNSATQTSRDGRTLYQQSVKAFNNGIKNITISGWNAWITRRACHSKDNLSVFVAKQPNKNTSDKIEFDDLDGYIDHMYCDNTKNRAQFRDFPANKFLDILAVTGGQKKQKRHPMFIDQNVGDRSRDLEPNRKTQDCYYQLMKYIVLGAKQGLTDIDSTAKSKLEDSKICNFNLAR